MHLVHYGVYCLLIENLRDHKKIVELVVLLCYHLLVLIYNRLCELAEEQDLGLGKLRKLLPQYLLVKIPPCVCLFNRSIQNIVIDYIPIEDNELAIGLGRDITLICGVLKEGVHRNKVSPHDNVLANSHGTCGYERYSICSCPLLEYLLTRLVFGLLSLLVDVVEDIRVHLAKEWVLPHHLTNVRADDGEVVALVRGPQTIGHSLERVLRLVLQSLQHSGDDVGRLILAEVLIEFPV